ncbi:hypothetical protein GmHk_05G014070 [Glycine max]|nr:hypothetical protein GmHk_05G014070 [Glycine max]
MSAFQVLNTARRRFSFCTYHFSSTPNNKNEKRKIPLRITYTDYQSIRLLWIRNPLVRLHCDDVVERDEREGDGHEGHEDRERHRVQPCLEGVKDRDGNSKVREQREVEALRGKVGVKGDAIEVVILWCDGVGIAVHELLVEVCGGCVGEEGKAITD